MVRVVGQVSNPVRAASPSLAQAVGDVRYAASYSATYFFVAALEVAPALATQRVKFRFRNPSASGKTPVVLYMAFLCNAARTVHFKTLTASASDFGTLITPFTKGSVGASAVLSVSQTLGDVADDTQIFGLTRLQANVPYLYAEPWRIPAGNFFDVQFSNGDSATTDRMGLYAEFYEEAP